MTRRDEPWPALRAYNLGRQQTGGKVAPPRKVSYVDGKVANRAAQAAAILGELEEAGVNLLAFTGFPDKGGKSQTDLVTDDLAGVRRVARRQGWRLSKAR